MFLHVGKDKVKLRQLWSYGVREKLRARPISAGIDIFPPRTDHSPRVCVAGHARGMECTHMYALLYIIFGARSMRVRVVWNGPETTTREILLPRCFRRIMPAWRGNPVGANVFARTDALDTTLHAALFVKET